MPEALRISRSPTERYTFIGNSSLGHGGFDNGTLVRGTEYIFEAEPGLVYSFKVTAVNKGGESFPSEILSAYQAKKSKGTILIVNGFDRLSGPATVESPFLQGFDLNTDPGIPYINIKYGFCAVSGNLSGHARCSAPSARLLRGIPPSATS